MLLIITARKEVPDIEAAQRLFDIVKQKLEDRPDIDLTGQVNEVLVLNQEE